MSTTPTLEKARAAHQAALADLAKARIQTGETKKAALDYAALYDLGEVKVEVAQKHLAEYRKAEATLADVAIRVEALAGTVTQAAEAEARAQAEADSRTRSDVEAKAGELVRDLDHWIGTFQALYSRFVDLETRFKTAARRGETSANLLQALNRVQVIGHTPIPAAIDRLRQYAQLTGPAQAAQNERLNRKIERAAKIAIRESEPMPKNAGAYRMSE